MTSPSRLSIYRDAVIALSNILNGRFIGEIDYKETIKMLDEKWNEATNRLTGYDMIVEQIKDMEIEFQAIKEKNEKDAFANALLHDDPRE